MTKDKFLHLLFVFGRLKSLILLKKSSHPTALTNESVTPSLLASMAETSEAKSLNTDVTPWFADFRFFSASQR